MMYYFPSLFGVFVFTRRLLPAAKAWSNYMEQESNLAIKSLYQHISELDALWVMLHQRYRLQLPEHRRLHKQLLSGEQELAKLRKQAAAAAARSTKLGKQLDDSLLKKRPSKALDMKKFETLEADLRQAVKEDKTAQRQYAMAVDNHKKFKHKEVKKTLITLAETESQLYLDCWRIAELKSNIIKLYLDHRNNEQSEANVHRAASESREAINALYKNWGTVVFDESEQERPVQPAVLQYPSQLHLSNTSQALPSAPTADILEQIEDDDAHHFYNPIPEIDSDNEEYEPNYIYEFDDNDFDDENNEVYEDVPNSEERNYLELIGAGSELETEEEEIFGSIASLNLRPQNRIAVDETADINQRNYGRLWQARSSEGNNTDNNSSSSNSRQHSDVSATSQGNTEIPRYVKYPGSIGEKPAVSNVRSMISNLEEELKFELQQFRERKQKKERAPPVPPRRN